MESFSNLKLNEKLVLISILILPFFKGLFFKENFLPVFIFYAVILVVFIMESKSLILDWKFSVLFLLQVGFGIITTVFSINKEAATYGLLILIFPIILYLLLLNLIHDISVFYELTLWILFISGSIISLINYMMEMKYNTTNLLIRFTWVIPYANTLAVFLFASSVAGLYLLSNKNFEKREKIIILLGISLTISGLVFTYSRTMLFLAFVFYILLTLFQKSRKTVLDFFFLFILSGISVVLYSFFKWRSILFIFILCALLAYVYEVNRERIVIRFKSFYLYFLKNKKMLLLPILLISLAMLAGFLLLRTTDIYHRLQTISTSDQTLLERFSYYKDSLSIIRDFPLFGIGPGGWASIMDKYQTAVYFPTFVHSVIMQTMLNFGLLGLVIFLLQILLFLQYFIYAFRKTSKYKNEVFYLFIINLSILLHAVIDIDFEFQIISILFWLNIVLISLLSGRGFVSFRIGKGMKSSFSIILIILILSDACLYASNSFYLKGVNSFEKQNFLSAVESFDSAIKFNPFSSSSIFMEGSTQWELYLKTSEKKIMEEARNNIYSAEKKDRFNPEYINKEAAILFSLKEYGESIKKYEALIQVQPLKLGNYEGYAKSLLFKAKEEFNSGNISEARSYFNRILKIESQLNSLRDKLSTFAFKLKHKPELTLSPELSYNVSEVFYYLQNFEKARVYSNYALEDNSYIEKVAELKSRFEKHI